MTTIPQSPFLSADPLTAETAAAVNAASPDTAAADLLPKPSNEGRYQGASTATPTVTVAAGAVDATNHIHEIFHFARKLCDDDHRFVLDEQAFMEAIEPPPLFLQRATG